MTGHPSEYALDRAALGAATPDVADHVARCSRCSDAVAARRAPVEPPAWLASVKLGPERRRRPRWWILPIPLLAAAAALVVAVHGGTIRDGAAGLREKGAPRVTVFVKRGDAVAPWDGRAAIRPGDRLAISVRGSGYAHVSIASLTAPETPAVLWAGPLQQDGDTVTPLSFRVDAQGGDEVLSVVLSTDRISPAQHVAAPRRDGRVWSVRLDIPKEVPR